MKYLLSTILLSLLTNSILAQETNEKKNDSIQRNRLEEVVLTGQYNAQSVNKSVFEIEVLNQEDIQLLAGNNLADVLTQTLNMNVVPQPGKGRSGIEQFGFSSGYVKILVDNIPIIGDEGFGNAIDVTQINLDDIKQIEIIEGSMGVQYGADAVTGVVNIITKKSSDHRWQITPYIQEETVGNEYGWFDEGRHIQSLKVGHNFSDKWYAQALYTRNDYKGFLNNLKGKNYYNHHQPEPINDSLRGYEWLPKEQNTFKGLVNFNNQKYFRAFYKFEYFTEETLGFANNVNFNKNSATQTVNPTANDEIFSSERFYHHLNVSGEIDRQVNYNISASYQQQVKNYEQFTYYLNSGKKERLDKYDYNTRNGFFSRGTFSNFFNGKKANFELGYEAQLDEGTQSGLALQDISQRNKKNKYNTYSGFVSSEIKPNQTLSFRPGFRLMTSSRFNPQYVASLSTKINLPKDYQLRLIAGTAPKLPDFDQLFTYMVDSNHNVQGNESLRPENGKSIFLHLKKTFWSKDYKLKFRPKLSAWYLDIDDKIDLIVVSNSPLAYRYENIDLYRTWGLSLRNNLSYKNLKTNLGISFSGQSQILNANENYNDDYLYSVQVNTNISYTVDKWDTTFSTFFKYNGPTYQFVYDGDNSDEITKSKLEGFGWLNTSIRKTFFDDIVVTLGARNVLDVTRVNLRNGPGSTHANGAQSQLLGYGRSYFLKLLYNLNF